MTRTQIDAVPDGTEYGAAPTLGLQVDRMGRPAINTALIGLLDSSSAGSAKKAAYNEAASPMDWPAADLGGGRTTGVEIAVNAAIFDVIDKGLGTVAGNGCGNGPLYAAPPSATSYAMLASVLADDQLFVDTSIASCGSYLAIEAAIAETGAKPHTECGGRTPGHDIIDVTYSLLAAGAAGFDPQNGLAPRITDGVAVHDDVDSSSFPFLGTPR